MDFAVDSGTVPSQFLQIRELHPDTEVHHLVTAITKLPDVRIRRVLVLQDAQGQPASVAFIEFRDSNAAAEALTLASVLPGKGFSVKGKPVPLSFVHPGVFAPVYDASEPGSFKATNSDQWLRYWNDEYHCTIHVPDDAIQEDTVDMTTRKNEASQEGSRKRKAAASGGVTIKSGSGGMIGHWSRKQEELNGVVQSEAPTSFADFNIKACLLCSRRFKSDAELTTHEENSALHASNLQNSAVREKGIARVRARRGAIPVTLEKDASHEYRDRARERRIHSKQAGEQIEMPARKRPRATQPSHRGEEEEDEGEEGERGPSKGAQLLQKMGYVSGGLGKDGTGRAAPVVAETYLPGVGLGSAHGKLDATQAEARRNVTDYKSFVASVKEDARARYHQTQQ